MDAKRRQLRATFDSAAALYQRARPEYPTALYADLIRVAGLRPGDQLVEVGCASGKATLPLARLGFRITCIELGAQLAAAARRTLAAFSGVEVVNAAFEEWRPPAGKKADLVFAANAWNWIDPDRRFGKAWEVLRAGGHLAIWDAAHVFPVGGDPFFKEIQSVYDEIGEGMSADAAWPRPGELSYDSVDAEARGLFETVYARQFDWEVAYDAAGYLDLLSTFSGHIAMSGRRRGRLYGEIRRRLALRPDGLVRRHWGAALQVARRVP